MATAVADVVGLGLGGDLGHAVHQDLDDDIGPRDGPVRWSL